MNDVKASLARVNGHPTDCDCAVCRAAFNLSRAGRRVEVEGRRFEHHQTFVSVEAVQREHAIAIEANGLEECASLFMSAAQARELARALDAAANEIDPSGASS